jgi:hypothetical protein
LTSITAFNVDAVKREVLLAQVIASCALVNVDTSISSWVCFESRKALAVETSESIRASGLVAANKRILRAFIDVTALNKFAGEDNCVEARLALANERTVGVLASGSDRWTEAFKSALVDIFTIGRVNDTLVSLDAFARKRAVVVQAVFKV